MIARTKFTLSGLFRKITGRKVPLTKIYGFYKKGVGEDMGTAFAVDQHGTILVREHFPNRGQAPNFLGMDSESTRKHITYDEHHPNGWSTEFVPSDRMNHHQGLISALKKMNSDYVNTDSFYVDWK